jgi:hypothetical protein
MISTRLQIDFQRTLERHKSFLVSQISSCTSALSNDKTRHIDASGCFDQHFLWSSISNRSLKRRDSIFEQTEHVDCQLDSVTWILRRASIVIRSVKNGGALWNSSFLKVVDSPNPSGLIALGSRRFTYSNTKSLADLGHVLVTEQIKLGIFTQSRCLSLSLLPSFLLATKSPFVLLNIHILSSTLKSLP